MRQTGVALAFLVSGFLSGVLFGGCGSGGAPAAQTSSNLTAQEIFDQCVSGDLLDFAGVLELVQGILQGDGTNPPPTPQIDLLQGILQGGIFPWSLDVDGDTVPDLTGTIHLRDSAGDITLPLGVLGGLDPDNLDIPALIAGLPPGTTLHLDFDLSDLILASTETGSGTGSVVVAFADGAIASASGSGRFAAGPCDMGFSFSDLDAAALSAAGFPIADFDFDVAVDGRRATGVVSFDGTDTAIVRTRVGTGPEESFPLLLTPPAPPPPA